MCMQVSSACHRHLWLDSPHQFCSCITEKKHKRPGGILRGLGSTVPLSKLENLTVKCNVIPYSRFTSLSYSVRGGRPSWLEILQIGQSEQEPNTGESIDRVTWEKRRGSWRNSIFSRFTAFTQIIFLSHIYASSCTHTYLTALDHINHRKI